MPKIAFFQTHRYERENFQNACEAAGFEVSFFEPRLTAQTAPLAQGHDVVCSFVNDDVDRKALEELKEKGVKLITLRCAGFNHVDIAAAKELELPVVRVPAYSPHAIAEHAVCLLLSLSRKVHKAHMRIQNHNFSLDGLVGFNLHGKKVGVIGTGKIGATFGNIMKGFNCEVLAYDPYPTADFRYVELDELLTECDIISLHVPLTPDTHHLLNEKTLNKMKKGSFIINTSRGALIDTQALIDALKTEQIGGAGLDVYEEEEGLFFQDLSDEILQDDLFARLISFPNTVVTSHQAFLTKEALGEITETTISNIKSYLEKNELPNQVN
jgi:D-lactate dehydrogenase